MLDYTLTQSSENNNLFHRLNKQLMPFTIFPVQKSGAHAIRSPLKKQVFHGCNDISKGTKRSAPFAISNRQMEIDAYYHQYWEEFRPITADYETGETAYGEPVHLKTIVPAIYGEIATGPDGKWWGFGDALDYIGIVGKTTRMKTCPARSDCLEIYHDGIFEISTLKDCNGTSVRV